ncbi:MAG: hypothetical protein LBN08_02960 [Lactobacillales bacterium]|nr:hypothetical protein [Lactobacillales bacterium]
MELKGRKSRAKSRKQLRTAILVIAVSAALTFGAVKFASHLFSTKADDAPLQILTKKWFERTAENWGNLTSDQQKNQSIANDPYKNKAPEAIDSFQFAANLTNPVNNRKVTSYTGLFQDSALNDSTARPANDSTYHSGDFNLLSNYTFQNFRENYFSVFFDSSDSILNDSSKPIMNYRMIDVLGSSVDSTDEAKVINKDSIKVLNIYPGTKSTTGVDSGEDVINDGGNFGVVGANTASYYIENVMGWKGKIDFDEVDMTDISQGAYLDFTGDNTRNPEIASTIAHPIPLSGDYALYSGVDEKYMVRDQNRLVTYEEWVAMNNIPAAKKSTNEMYTRYVDDLRLFPDFARAKHGTAVNGTAYEGHPVYGYYNNGDVRPYEMYAYSTGKKLTYKANDSYNTALPESSRQIGFYMLRTTIGDTSVAYNATPILGVVRQGKSAASYLKDENGKYKYDVIYLGHAPENNNRDISDSVLAELKKFVDAGRGIVFGPGTAKMPNLAKLMAYGNNGMSASASPASPLQMNTSLIQTNYLNETKVPANNMKESPRVLTYPYLMDLNMDSADLISNAINSKIYHTLKDGVHKYVDAFHKDHPITTPDGKAGYLQGRTSSTYFNQYSLVSSLGNRGSIDLLGGIIVSGELPESEVRMTELQLLVNLLFSMVQTIDTDHLEIMGVADVDKPKDVDLLRDIDGKLKVTAKDVGTKHYFALEAMAEQNAAGLPATSVNPNYVTSYESIYSDVIYDEAYSDVAGVLVAVSPSNYGLKGSPNASKKFFTESGTLDKQGTEALQLPIYQKRYYVYAPKGIPGNDSAANKKSYYMDGAGNIYYPENNIDGAPKTDKKLYNIDENMFYSYAGVKLSKVVNGIEVTKTPNEIVGDMIGNAFLPSAFDAMFNGEIIFDPSKAGDQYQYTPAGIQAAFGASTKIAPMFNKVDYSVVDDQVREDRIMSSYDWADLENQIKTQYGSTPVYMHVLVADRQGNYTEQTFKLSDIEEEITEIPVNVNVNFVNDNGDIIKYRATDHGYADAKISYEDVTLHAKKEINLLTEMPELQGVLADIYSKINGEHYFLAEDFNNYLSTLSPNPFVMTLAEDATTITINLKVEGQIVLEVTDAVKFEDGLQSLGKQRLYADNDILLKIHDYTGFGQQRNYAITATISEFAATKNEGVTLTSLTGIHYDEREAVDPMKLDVRIIKEFQAADDGYVRTHIVPRDQLWMNIHANSFDQVKQDKYNGKFNWNLTITNQ